MITKMCKFCTYSCCENMLWMLNKLRGTSASWKLDSKSQLSSVAHGDAHSYWAFWMVLECVCVLDPLKLYLCLLNWVPSNGQIEGKSFRFSVCGFISKWQIYAGKWKMSNDLNDEKTLQCSNLREPTIARTRVFKTQLFFTNVLSAYFSVCFLCICVRSAHIYFKSSIHRMISMR